jgi:hypothetical protein
MWWSCRSGHYYAAVQCRNNDGIATVEHGSAIAVCEVCQTAQQVG